MKGRENVEHTELPQELQATFPVETVVRIGKRKAKDTKIFVTVILNDGKRHRFEVLADGTYKFQSLVEPDTKETKARGQIALPEVGETPAGPAPTPVIVLTAPAAEADEDDVLLA